MAVDTYSAGQALAIDKDARVCDVCDGSGMELDVEHEHYGECHLCEGSGWFGADGFPLCDPEDDDAPKVVDHGSNALSEILSDALKKHS